MSSCCACCCFYPKYKRKVDNIYPRQSDAPLVKNEVDKLLYYATVHPEKLSKIGEYLYQNLKWALNNGYKYAKYIENTIEAIEKILLAITPQNLNYYAPTYLKVIQKLLEQGYGLSSRPMSHTTISNSSSYGTLNNNNNASNESLRYHKKAAGLFQKFCQKECSNMSNYNLNFDHFVGQFSSLCFNNNKDESTRAEIRSSGLESLHTMVQRLEPDDNLRAGYIWDNMDKIISGVLFIIQEGYVNRQNNADRLDHSDYDYHQDEEELAEYIYGDLYTSTRLRSSMDNQKEEKEMNQGEYEIKIEYSKRNSDLVHEESVVIGLKENRSAQINEPLQPEHEAKCLLRNICAKADYTTISKIVVPILNFLDDNRQHGWDLTKFVRCTFLIVIYNVRQQHAFVVRELLKHLDSHRNSAALLKCKIIRTIILCTKISAMQSVGTTGQIIDIFNNLLKHLNISVEKADNLTDENKLQKEIISAMRQFAENMPDYAKNDILVFFARQINTQQFSCFDQNSSVQQTQDKNELELLNGRKRAKYYECLYEICTKYRPVQLFGAFGSQQFLDDSLKLILVSDYASRKKANEILQLLIDKYKMLDRIQLLKPIVYKVPLLVKASTLSLSESNASLNNNRLANGRLSRNQTFLSQISLDDKTKFWSSRDDTMFMRKYGRAILSHFTEYLFIGNNRRDNYESAFITMYLLVIGFLNDSEFLIDFIRFGFYLQELALLNHDSATFTFSLQCSVHKFICAYFLLVCKASQMVDLYQYASEICDMRRRKDLYKFVYPEYLLVEWAGGDSGIQSQASSFSEIETELRKEMTESAKEYRAYVDRLSRRTDNQIEWTVKLAPWMLDKKRVEQILLKNNYNFAKSLFDTDAEYSLSSTYVQQLVCVQSALRYRNPYSNEGETASDDAAASRGHIRGYSGFSYGNQTPRRSVDMQSMEDDTSYDSTSQISVDHGFELDPMLKENMKFFIDDNQATLTSGNQLRTNCVDLTSFDTIRRMLFNSGSNINASNMSNSGVGVSSSAFGHGSSVVQAANAAGLIVTVSAEEQHEKNQKIIRDFYQMPFDEIKQNLLRTNQSLACSDKYQQVLDYVSKDYADANASASSISTNTSVHSHLNKENQNQSRTVALSDIEFPRLFIN